MTFIFKNTYVPIEKYMDSVLLNARNPELYPLTEEYNRVLKEAILSNPHFTGESLLLTLDNLWNKAIAAGKENKGINIFLDGIDAFFYSTAASDYLLAILSGCEVLHVPITMTVQNAASICADSDAKVEFECFLRTVTFAKLLNQGPVERRVLQETFALPDALVRGMTDQPPGHGVLITPKKTVMFEAAENF